MKNDLEGVCQDCAYLEKIRPLFDEKDKEIERLKNKVKEINEEMNYQINLKTKNANEINRLNNIINELEDSIVGKINVLYQVRGQSNAIQELGILLRQLRELKGDSSNV